MKLKSTTDNKDRAMNDFKVGDLVRYSSGPTALVRLDSPHAGGWHGEHCLGGYRFVCDIGWGQSRMYHASPEDYKTWYDTAKWRK